MEAKEFLIKLQKLVALTQAGLTYCEDIFDLERYAEIKEISEELISSLTGDKIERVKEFYPDSGGYLTPKVDVRAVVMRENKILLVKEKADERWSLPGGWADIGITPAENAVKEVREESGFEVKVIRLLGVQDKRKHSPQTSYMYIYKLFFLCEITGGDAVIGTETTGVRFFGLNELPPLSVGRNTEEQIRLMFRMAEDESILPVFD
ncbi:MAG: NUDIX hydrolase [Ignavibacteriaceae bacterium]